MLKLVFILFLSLTACSNTPSVDNLEGQWTIQEEKSAAQIVGIGEEESSALMNEKLVISQHQIQLQNQVCQYDEIKQGEQSVTEFLELYRLDTTTQFPKNTRVLNLECEGEFVIAHVLKSDSTLWFVWYGLLLEATRKPA
jgi:hypothetical protein